MMPAKTNGEGRGTLWLLAGEQVEVRVRFRSGTLTWELAQAAPGRPAVGPSELAAPTFENGRMRRWTRADGAIRRMADGTRVLRVRATASGPAPAVTWSFQVFPGHPFVRVWSAVLYRGRRPGPVSGAELLRLLLPWPEGGTLFHVEQFSWTYRPDRFTPHAVALQPGRAPLELRMGSHPALHAAPTSCGWIAVRRGPESPTAPGIVAGIEFNGKSLLTARTDGRGVGLVSVVEPMRAALPGTETLELPGGFIGLYQGDWDDAAHATHRFAETHVHPPPPDGRFPWVMYNSWGYGRDIHEASQLAAVECCAALGVEAVVLDLGWSAAIGDWRPDPVKFPRGLKPVARRARSLGMRFGIHLALAQADPASPVARRHPGWLTGGAVDYFGSLPLCLGHRPCRAWVIREIIRAIDATGASYVVQDGEDMVKPCARNDHTHVPNGDNFANAAGLDAVVTAVRRARPHVVWENCEGGGCMQTYRMARLYHTSITVDNIGTYATRQGVYGASYPFSLRYSVRYMQDGPTPYTLRSAMFGGPLILMQRVTELTRAQMAETKAAVAQYKALRAVVRGARVVHLLRPESYAGGEGWGWDAIQAVAPDRARSVVMIYRARGGKRRMTIRPRGLDADAAYTVRFADRRDVVRLTGRDLAERGFEVALGELGSEIASISLQRSDRGMLSS